MAKLRMQLAEKDRLYRERAGLQDQKEGLNRRIELKVRTEV